MTIHKPLSSTSLEEYRKKIQPLKTAFDYLSDHVIITDPNGQIIYANNAVEKTTGFSKEEILGKNPGDLWGSNMPHELYEHMWKTIRYNKKPFVGEVKNKRKDGTEYWQELHISPILDDKNDITFFIAIEPNITDKKKKEQFREEFISIIGHQLLSPLTTIHWTLSLLTKDGKITQAEKHSLQTIYETNKNLLNLVGDLLTLSHIENANTAEEVIRVIDEIEKIIELAKIQHANESFIFHKPEQPIMIKTNKALALQIFTNVILNAAEYSDSTAGVIVIDLKTEGTSYLFSVNDNGIGIPKEEQEKIFSRFFRASNAKKAKANGTGLGLFIVKLIADSLGWGIRFESEPSKGTTFFITINE